MEAHKKEKVMEQNLDSCIRLIREQVEYGYTTKFNGNIEFRVNFKDGVVGHVNVSVNQSFKVNKED